MEHIIEYCKKYDNVIIYGAGKVGVQLGKDLISRGICIQNYVVSSTQGQLKELNGIKVKSIEDVVIDDNTGIIVGVSLGKINKIIENLVGWGRTDYLILKQDYLNSIIARFERPTMEITTEIGCKVNCKYCPQKLLIGQYFKSNQYRVRRMELETFKRCLDKVPYNSNISFAGMVEPFQNPECMDMIRYAVSKEKYLIGVYTTCVGMTETMALELVDMPIEECVIHMPDENGYAHIPLTEEYWKVVSILLDAKKSSGKRFVDYVSCQGKPVQKFLDINKNRVRVESQLHDRAGHLENSDNKLESCKSRLKGKIYCSRRENLDHNILLPDGTVVLCCMDYGLQYPLGNLCEASYEEILQGEVILNIRKAMLDDNINILCRQCTFAMQKK